MDMEKISDNILNLVQINKEENLAVDRDRVQHLIIMTKTKMLVVCPELDSLPSYPSTWVYQGGNPNE